MIFTKEQCERASQEVCFYCKHTVNLKHDTVGNSCDMLDISVCVDTKMCIKRITAQVMRS